MQSSKSAMFSVGVLLLTALARVGLAGETCGARPGEACPSAAPAVQAVAGALTAEQQHSRLHLLQREAGRHIQESAAPGHRAAAGRSAADTGKRRGRLARTCDKAAGGACTTDVECDPNATSATCDGNTSLCVCPPYTCLNENGTCMLSADEIGSALRDGVQDVGMQVGKIAALVPGIADSLPGILDAAAGIADTVSGVLGDIFGVEQNCNSRFVGTCFWSPCDPALGFTVDCVWGSCQCKEGFCANNSVCAADIEGIMQGFNFTNTSD